MLRQQVASVLRQPAFSVPAVLTIAMGVGVTTAIFSLVYAILLRPFPYPRAEELVRVSTVMTAEKGAERNCSLLDIEDYNRRAKLLKNAGGYTEFDSQIEGDGPAESVTIAQLNQEALHAVGVQPVLGRLFRPDEDRKGGPINKAILSHALWSSRYGSDRAILGRSVRTPQGSFEVIGVMPPGFAFPDRAGIWLTMESWYALELDTYRGKLRDQRWYTTIARLQPGVTLGQAETELQQIAADLAREYPRENAGVTVRLTPLRDAEVGPVRPYLYLLLGGVALVLLICVANVANLMLARVLARRRQYVIQAALGAGRFHLVQGVLMESLLLAIAGGAAGAGLAWAGVRAFHQLLPASVPLWMKIEVDWPVLLFCLTLTMLTGLACGAFPAWIGSRVDLNDALKQGSRGGSQRSAGRGLLVVLEVALSLMLLVGAGLLMKTFLRLQYADHGFTPDNLIVARVNNGHLHKGTRSERAALLAQYHDRVLSALAAIPGVTSVAATNSLPYSGQEPRKGRLRVKGRADDELRFLLPVAGADVSWSYLQTMGIPLVKGRHFNSSDGSAAAPVVILNETGAKALLGERDPIGQMVQWGDTADASNPYCRVVGVVRDIKQEAVAHDTITVFYPHTQWPIRDAHYVLRTRMDGKALMPLIRRAVQETDRNAAIAWMKPMNERIDEVLWQRRLWGVLFSLFAVLAVALAGVGLYGLLSYTVSQSMREIGIRLAIGASPGKVLAGVAGRGMGLVAAGLLTGGLGAFAGSRAIAHLLEGVSPFDVTIYAAVAALLAGVGVLASLVPALRAARVDPLIALRDE